MFTHLPVFVGAANGDAKHFKPQKIELTIAVKTRRLSRGFHSAASFPNVRSTRLITISMVWQPTRRSRLTIHWYHNNFQSVQPF
jgi:hypothetical protein